MTTDPPSRRFVVLRHEGVAEPHFDLLIESRPEGLLETWRSLVWPIDEKTPLVHLPPHRRVYLDYEGPISNDRGSVRRVESGRCAVEVDSNGRWIIEARSDRREFSLMLAPAGEPDWIGQQNSRQ